MTIRLALPLLACLAVAACKPPEAAPPPMAEAAKPRIMAAADYVKTFYAAEPAWGTDEEVRALFAPDLAEAILKDRKAHEGEVPSIDFAFQCGCQDGQITDVTTTGTDTDTGARVAANFKLEGQPTRIDYVLTRTEHGWKVADVSAPAQRDMDGWDIRQMVGLARL